MAEQAWKWWSGSNNELYANGPFLTREEAIDALCDEGGFIVEAQQGAVRFSAKRLLDDQYFEDEDGFDFENVEPDRIGNPAEIARADEELQALLDGWVNKWRHTFVTPNLFVAQRNEERIPAGENDHDQL